MFIIIRKMTDLFYNNLDPREQIYSTPYLIYNLKEQNYQKLQQEIMSGKMPRFDNQIHGDTINLTPKYRPSFEYENKKMINRNLPIQTEQDEIDGTDRFLEHYKGYKEYGNYIFTTDNLPKNNNLRRTPQSNIFDVI